MLLEFLAASAIAPISTDWEVLDGVYEGRAVCGVSQTYADGTSLLFAVEENDAEQNSFAFMAWNRNWSIKEGERIGDVSVTTDAYSFGSIAQTGPGQFVIGSFLDRLIPFLRSAQDSGFAIKISERKKDIGTFSAAGLQPAADRLETCIRHRFVRPDDPFAR